MRTNLGTVVSITARTLAMVGLALLLILVLLPAALGAQVAGGG